MCRQPFPSFRGITVGSLFLGAFLALNHACLAAPPAQRVAPDGTDLVTCGTELVHSLSRCRTPEIVEMLWALAGGSSLGPGQGWFHAGQSRYNWQWLAGRCGAGKAGRITRGQFQGPAEWFDRLDRDHDGVLTAADFDWAGQSSMLQQNRPTDVWFFLMDRDSNGRISRAEWDTFFRTAAKGKKYLTPDDLRQALTLTPPSRTARAAPAGPSPEVLLRGFLTGELGSFREGPAIDEKAPDFSLPTHDGKESYSLAQSRGKKPVVLIFGSFT